MCGELDCLEVLEWFCNLVDVQGSFVQFRVIFIFLNGCTNKKLEIFNNNNTKLLDDSLFIGNDFLDLVVEFLELAEFYTTLGWHSGSVFFLDDFVEFYKVFWDLIAFGTCIINRL